MMTMILVIVMLQSKKHIIPPHYSVSGVRLRASCCDGVVMLTESRSRRSGEAPAAGARTQMGEE